MITWLSKFFQLQTLQTNIKTEFIAGLTTFVTMAYIIIVQPTLMRDAGLPFGAVMVSTIIVSAIFSLLMGIYAKRPFGVSVGMGGNSFFASTIVAGGLATWQTALGMVFIAGAIFFLLTLFGLREAIVKMIPKNIKIAITSAVGIFIVGLGLSNAGLIVANQHELALANLHDKNMVLVLIGLVITLGLMARRIKGAVIIGIFIVTIIGIPLGVTKLPTSYFQMPPSPKSIMFHVDWLQALKWSFFPLIFTFFTSEFFSTLGTVLGVGAKAGLLDKNGNLPDMKKPFYVDSLATMGGAMMGTTPVTTFIESASGAEVGGRSGLTAVFVAFFFVLSLLLTPFFLMIPSVATAPVLIVIGISMLSELKNIDYGEFSELAPAFITVLITGFTFSIANGIVFGVLSYVFIKIFAGKIKEIPFGLYILCIPLIYYLWIL